MTKGKWVSKKDFDAHYEDDRFAVGPFQSEFGSGYGEPYNPHRKIWGILKDGTRIWSRKSGPQATEDPQIDEPSA